MRSCIKTYVKHLNCQLYYRQLHLKYLGNLARHWLQASWGRHDCVETCRSVIICEIIVHLLVTVQNKVYCTRVCVCVCVCGFSPQYTSLTFKRPICAYVITHKKSPLEIHFKYLGNKEPNCSFEPCCIITVSFPTKCHIFHNLKLLFNQYSS